VVSLLRPHFSLAFYLYTFFLYFLLGLLIDDLRVVQHSGRRMPRFRTAISIIAAWHWSVPLFPVLFLL